MSDIVRFEADEGVATITLNRPESMNAFTTALRADLFEALELGGSDDSVRVIILTGEGRSFSAGADLKDRPDRSVGEILQTEYRPAETGDRRGFRLGRGHRPVARPDL